MNIINQYVQTKFEEKENGYKFTGTCDVKDNQIIMLQVSVVEIETGTHIGNMNISNTGTSVSLMGSTKLEDLTKFSETLIRFRSELETVLLE